MKQIQKLIERLEKEFIISSVSDSDVTIQAGGGNIQIKVEDIMKKIGNLKCEYYPFGDPVHYIRIKPLDINELIPTYRPFAELAKQGKFKPTIYK